jgi:hypothetical protein
MFDFRKKHLYPVLRQFVERINGALPLNKPDQAAGLLDLKKDITTSLNKMAQGQGRWARVAGLTTLVATAGLITLAAMMPPAAIVAGIGAAVAFVGGTAVTQKFSLNKGAITQGRHVLTEKIDAEVIQAMPNFLSAYQAPDFKARLIEAFDTAANKKEYDSLARRALKVDLPKPKAKAPVAA